MLSQKAYPGRALHLVFLIHGGQGFPSDMQTAADILQSSQLSSNSHDSIQLQSSQPSLAIRLSNSSPGDLAADGVDVCGERALVEFEDVVAQLESPEGGNNQVRRLSIVGFSMGGCVARYLAGLLFARGWFERIEPVNFTTFATPHLGLLNLTPDLRAHFTNTVGQRVPFLTSRQMYICDTYRQTRLQLFAVMADPGSIFVHALKRFKKKIVYGNAVNDRSVPFYSACITADNPFSAGLEALSGVEYIDDSKNVVVAPKSVVKCSSHPLMMALKRLILVATFYLFFPFMLLLLLAAKGRWIYKTAAASKVRVEKHGEEMARRYGKESAFKSDADMDSFRVTTGTSIKFYGEEAKVAVECHGTPTLVLSGVQKIMKDVLCSLAFQRLAVHVRDPKSSHNALVCVEPHQKKGDGVVVLSHWAKNFRI